MGRQPQMFRSCLIFRVLELCPEVCILVAAPISRAEAVEAQTTGVEKEPHSHGVAS